MNSPTSMNMPLAEHPEVINAFVEAAMAMLRELTQYESWPENPGLADTIELTESGPRIAARLRLLRHQPGELVLELAAPSAQRLAARYLPPDTPLAADLVDDTVGEFANVVAGQAKTMLKGTPFHFSLSTPVVTRFPDDQSRRERSGDRVAIVVGFEEGQLRLEISLTSEPGS